jgi:hypothetical protein
MSAEFSPDQAKWHLEAKGAMEGPCPVCGKIEWRIAAALSGVSAVTSEDKLDLSDGMAARVLPVICTHCGFVRLHDWRTLSD